MKKFITYLYNRFCKVGVDNLYLGGIQRNFDVQLDERDRRNRQKTVYDFLQTPWLVQVINETLKEYAEVLFNNAETQAQRDCIHNNINVLIKLEKKFKGIGTPPSTREKHDPYESI